MVPSTQEKFLFKKKKKNSWADLPKVTGTWCDFRDPGCSAMVPLWTSGPQSGQQEGKEECGEGSGHLQGGLQEAAWGFPARAWSHGHQPKGS